MAQHFVNISRADFSLPALVGEHAQTSRDTFDSAERKKASHFISPGGRRARSAASDIPSSPSSRRPFNDLPHPARPPRTTRKLPSNQKMRRVSCQTRCHGKAPNWVRFAISPDGQPARIPTHSRKPEFALRQFPLPPICPIRCTTLHNPPGRFVGAAPCTILHNPAHPAQRCTKTHNPHPPERALATANPNISRTLSSSEPHPAQDLANQPTLCLPY